MSLLKDTGACAFDGVKFLLKLIADKQMKHAKTSLLVKSSSLLVLNVTRKSCRGWVTAGLIRNCLSVIFVLLEHSA